MSGRRANVVRKIITLWVFTFLGIGIMMGPGVSLAVSPGPAESEVKAAFVFNFIKFVEWPRGTFPPGEKPLTLCVLGQDPLGEALGSLEGKTAQSRKIEVRRVSTPGDAEGCQVLYVCRSEAEQMTVILRRMKPGVLTIGDMRYFASSGGIINLILLDNRISFEISVDAAEKAGLKISSQLLKLAQVVRSQGGREGK